MKQNPSAIKFNRFHYIIACPGFRSDDAPYFYLYEPAGMFLADSRMATIYDTPEMALEKMDEAKRDLKPHGELCVFPIKLSINISGGARSLDYAEMKLLRGAIVGS